MTLAGHVSGLERDRKWAYDLLGEVVATLVLNREKIEAQEWGREFMKIADNWIFHYQKRPKRLVDVDAGLLEACKKIEHEAFSIMLSADKSTNAGAAMFGVAATLRPIAQEAISKAKEGWQ